MLNPSEIRIGIIGGGQLGKMMTLAAKKMGFYVTILDPTPNCPAGQVADYQIVGDFFSKRKLKELVLRSNVTTFDIERADEYLVDLEKQGYLIYPSPQILRLIQNKLKQKELLIKNKIPTPKFSKVNTNLATLVKEFNFPVVQKMCFGGYDGRGVFIINNKKELAQAVKSDSFLEEYVNIEKELAINIARSSKGEIKCYPVIETTFNPKANICETIIAPARVSAEIVKKAKELGIRTIKALGKGAIGIFGVEMFLTKDRQILINEIAPRPHNSGHYTIEACHTSQFEQHIRSIVGLPLGSTELISPAVMLNILGEPKYEGKPLVKALEAVLKIPGLSFHYYGKAVTKPFRKMGHITVLDKNVKQALAKAKKAQKLIKVISQN